jgi:hypothetical protein
LVLERPGAEGAEKIRVILLRPLRFGIYRKKAEQQWVEINLLRFHLSRKFI